jgi:D-arabinose 1-dehydrogenase-like Zn-dependent alcohol dehydrogenase
LIPGHEIAGTVDQVGPGVANWTPGTRVGIGWFGGQCGQCASCRKGDFVTCAHQKNPGLLVDGGYAEYVVVPAAALVRVPDEMALVKAGPLMCAGVTAFNALRRGKADGGALVVVIGIGGIGHLAIQFARHMGCETIAVSRGQWKEGPALKLGAHHFIDLLDPNAVEKVSKLGGADVILTTAPSSAEVGRFLPAVAANGRIVVTGFSQDPVQISSVDLIARNLSVLGSAAGTPADAEEMLRFCVLNGISPVVEEFPFEAADQAYESMMAGTTHFRAVLNLVAASPVSTRPESPSRDRDQSADRTLGQDSGMRRAPVLLTRRADPVLDCPFEHLPGMNELIEAAVRWHFSPATGSTFWLERAKSFDFSPLRDVRTAADLRLFPNVTDELRFASVADLIPRGYDDDPPLVGVFESGGVTGTPKRVLMMTDWVERWVAWAVRVAEKAYQEKSKFLIVAPTGPHLMTYLPMQAVHRRHGMAFTIDLDPRWVRKLITEGRSSEADLYAEHIIDQTAAVLRTQDVNVLTITPPLLEKLVGRQELAELVRQKISTIIWGGTHMDADTRRLYRTEVFPGIMFQGGYGSSMALGGAFERSGVTDDHLCIFDPFSPYITFSVVDPQTRQDVPYGERGQVLMNHISKGMFIPNNLERDSAVRVQGLDPQTSDSVADVLPVRKIDGIEITEGVY